MGSAYTVRLIVCTNAETVVDDLYREAWQSDTSDFLRSAVTAARDAAEQAAQGTGVDVKVDTDSRFSSWNGGSFHNCGCVAWSVEHDERGTLLDSDVPANVLAVARKVNDAAIDAFADDLKESYRGTLAAEMGHLVRVLDEVPKWNDAARERVRWWIEEANGPRSTDAVRANAAKVAAALAAIK